VNILEDLYRILTGLGLDVETGVFSGLAPDDYVIITPMVDTFPLFGDNLPLLETQEVRLFLYSKTNYTNRKKLVVETLVNLGFTITAQVYIGREDDTGYFHTAVDVSKCYAF
jgi:hypothetical protein